MKTKDLKFLLALILFEGVGALLWMMWIPSEPETARLFGYSYSRLGFAGILAVALALLLVLVLDVFRSEKMAKAFTQCADEILVRRNSLYPAHDTLLGLLMLTAGAYSFTYLFFSPHLCSLLVWLGLIFLQAWVLLRKSYVANFRARVSWFAAVQTGWRSWTPTQQRIFWTLTVIGLIYFAAFIPANLQNADDPHAFFLHGGDEYITYPYVVVTMLTPGETFHTSMYRLFIYEDYHYGYPFYAFSALVLLVPRLIIGSSFADHTQINLLLLQMVNVLPMILSIFVLVYLVTRFKSWARAVSMFVVLLLIPGVVKYNVHFWHPDSLLLLFIVLTFYFLQRDRLRFGRDFYLAAGTCGLATATKLYGVFFFLAVGGYLLAGLIRRVLDFKKMMLAGLFFVLAMSATVVLANPFLFDSGARTRMVEIMQEKNAEMAQGYDEPDPQNIYRTGLEVWLPFFEQHYTQSYFFFFLFFALAAGSLWGSETYLNRLLLAWCVVVAGYLIYFVAVKSYQYMLPLMVPLYSGAFLFPEIANASGRTRWHKMLGHPRAKPILRTITALLCGSQFIVNLLKINAMR